MKIAVIIIRDSSKAAASRLADHLSADVYRAEKGELGALTAHLYHHYQGLVFFMASGIVVRMIAPLVKDKYHDPAIVTVDNACRYAISTLSGHEGGANKLCWKVASFLGAQAVITTASDTNKDIVMGIGCRKGMGKEDLKTVVLEILGSKELTPEQIRCAATMEVKKEEASLIKAFEEMNIPLVFHPLESLRQCHFPDLSPPGAAARHFDIPGVCEPCALLSARRGRLILKKTKARGITIALAKESL